MTDEMLFQPGMRVQHPDHPEWGIGQVQSSIAGRIVVTFPHAGKLAINSNRVALIPVFEDEEP
ncbi:MAG: DUF3553 domain-containing protein [Rhodobacteraceae bacterium]|nr:DUF3553 domain-containing protein [Paracoccaceae bacterium]